MRFKKEHKELVNNKIQLLATFTQHSPALEAEFEVLFKKTHCHLHTGPFYKGRRINAWKLAFIKEPKKPDSEESIERLIKQC